MREISCACHPQKKTPNTRFGHAENIAQVRMEKLSEVADEATSVEIHDWPDRNQIAETRAESRIKRELR